MSETIMIALISLLGNVFGSIAAIVAASKLMNYRVEKLEQKVNDIDDIRDRINTCEETNAVQNTKLAYISSQLDENKNKIDKLLERIPANA